jgi:hypothetical protein
MPETDDELADQLVKETMLEIMSVLYDHGFTQVSVGALMRLLGVEFDQAQTHDNDYLIIQDSIAEYSKNAWDTDVEIPLNTTIH